MLILLFKFWDFKVFKIDFMFIKGSYLCCCVIRICNNWFFFVFFIFVKFFRGVYDYIIKVFLGLKFLFKDIL